MLLSKQIDRVAIMLAKWYFHEIMLRDPEAVSLPCMYLPYIYASSEDPNYLGTAIPVLESPSSSFSSNGPVFSVVPSYVCLYMCNPSYYIRLFPLVFFINCCTPFRDHGY